MFLNQLNKCEAFRIPQMHDILNVIKNIQELYENNSSLAVLKDFERVLDEMDMYVYKNWIDGELAYGPKVDRHWITAGFMWPKDKMPDPTGAKRLVDLGCKVVFQRSHLIEPRKIRNRDDIRPGTKKGKLDHIPIWIVEIQMPKKVAFDMYKGYMDKLQDEINTTEAPKESAAIPGVAAPVAPLAPGAVVNPAAAPAGVGSTPSV
jgi:hypothetical protein